MNPQKLLKQFQQAQERIQREISELRVEASAGGGMVKVIMTGEKVIESVSIEREVVNPDDVEMLQDLVLAAVNEAGGKVDQELREKVGGLTGGLGLPGLG